ncbi:MAG: CDP-alcohol phosphatidyltransferase [Naasia sp.]|nr:CDP-alcohol phosphatidyltransferase [Naasia sp.]
MSTPSTQAARPGTARDESYRDVLGRLGSAQKKAARGAPAYSVYVNRRLGRFLAAWAYRAGLTPNGVTAISAVFTFAAIAAIAIFPPSLPLGLLVAAGLAVGYAFDSADGQLARLRGGGGPSGEWLDHVVDCVKTSSLHLAVLISVYRFFELPSDLLLLVPIGYAVVAATSFFAQILNDQLKEIRGVRGATAAGGGTLLRSLLVSPTDYGLLCLVFALLGAPPVFFLVYGLLFLANLGHLTLALRKWFRDMVAIDPRHSSAGKD